MNRIRVLLVEDDPFWKQQLSEDLQLESDIEFVGIADTKEAAVQAAQEREIDVILMDINLTGNNLDGLQAAEMVSRLNTQSKVIMLTSMTEKEVILKAFQVGAVNYITKSSYKDIVKAIRDAHAERAAIHSDAADLLRTEIQLMSLSPMEREVFELRKEGLSKTQISEKLSKSVNTIKSQLRSMKNKLVFFKED
ncbi:response regulator [Paenibacillus sp. MBLB4367]|uniref:response regulator n=1 Tax=Paenibacillus sp. MBLB4367 TaxID=3384767 RepID=UPI00390809A4